MKRKIFSVLIFSLVCFGCTNIEKPDMQTKPKAMSPIEMGVILPKTENLEYSQEIKNAMIFSAEEFNRTQAQKFSKINLFFLDINNNQEELYTALEVLKMRDTKIIHAGFTNQCAFELKRFEKTGALVNFFSQYPPVATQTENAVRIFLNGAQVCEEMTKKIRPAKNAKKSAIILTEDSTLGKSCGDFLKFQIGSLNLKIFTERFSEKEENFELLSKTINQSKIDYAIIFAPENKLQKILRALSKTNFKGEVYANCTLLNANFAEAKNLKLEKVKSAFELDKTKLSTSFKNTYQKRFGKEPSLASALAYDAVKITATAFLNSAKDAKKAKHFLTNKSFEGASGKINFDSYGDTTLPLELTK